MDCEMNNNKWGMYRVEVMPPKKGGKVIVDNLDDFLDDPIGGVYDSTDKLPDWVKKRLAVLTMTSSKPPTEYIDGIGRRMSETVFWIETI